METTGVRRAPAFIAAIVATAIAVAVAASMSIGVTCAYAGGGGFKIAQIQCSKTGLSYNPHAIDWWNTYAFISTKNLTKAKSSNPKVLEVLNCENKVLSLRTKKAGTAKLTYKEGGKSKSVTIVVKKYKNPFKVFKVGKQNCAKQYKHQCFGETKSVQNGCISGKLVIKPAKGWKIKVINAYGFGMKKMKNKSKVRSNTSTIQVLMQNKKTKVIQRAYLYMERTL